MHIVSESVTARGLEGTVDAVKEASKSPMPNPFRQEVVASLPRLRGLALALTRNFAEAEDLVQQVAVIALGAQDTFMPGTNFWAWVGTIMRNRFYFERRRHRESLSIDEVPGSWLAARATHDERLVMNEFHQAVHTLPYKQRQSLTLVAGHGLSYEQAAVLVGCATGTVKSRVFCARRTLRKWLQEQTR